VTVYASTNLMNWVSLLTNPPVIGTFQFIDAQATNWANWVESDEGAPNSQGRFYRATEQR
jgi:hypothetical protein